MRRQSIGSLFFGCAVVAGACRVAASEVVNAATRIGGQVLLHSNRQSPSDLEITGMVQGVAANSAGYIRYADLARMPQVAAVIDDDQDYPGVTMHASGVYLDTLAKAIGASPSSDLIDALCTDRYRSHYPADAIAAHHPILVLKIDGMRASAWAAHAHQYDPGPYLVLYERFVPAFHVLSHVDRPQLPTNVVRLNFSTTAATFGAIAPHGSFAPDSPEQQGFVIAKQNCLRCHSQGPYGGTKSGRTWTALSTWAREQPAFFAGYIHNPKATEPHAHMPANQEYDAATLAALTAYFRTFTAPTAAAKPYKDPAQEPTRR